MLQRVLIANGWKDSTNCTAFLSSSRKGSGLGWCFGRRLATSCKGRRCGYVAMLRNRIPTTVDYMETWWHWSRLIPSHLFRFSWLSSSQLKTNHGRFVLTSNGDLQIVQLHRTDAGTYVCVAFNGIGSSVEREVKLTVDGEFLSDTSLLLSSSDGSLETFIFVNLFWNFDFSCIVCVVLWFSLLWHLIIS